MDTAQLDQLHDNRSARKEIVRRYNLWQGLRLVRFLYVMVVVMFFILLPIQDFNSTQLIFGKLGASLSVFVFPSWCLMALMTRQDRTWMNRSVRRFVMVGLAFILYQGITSFIALSFVLPYESRQEVLWVKALKICVTFGIWLTIVLLGAQLAVLQPKLLKRLALILFLMLAGAILLEVVTGTFWLTGYEAGHHTNPHQSRIRLMTPEASLLAALTSSLAFLAALNISSSIGRRLLLVGLCALQYLILSRGTLMCMAIALGVVVFTNRLRWTNGTWFKEISMRVIAIIACAAIAKYTYQNLVEKMDEHSSVATRSVFAFSNWTALTDKPLGAGWSGYLVYGTFWLEGAIGRLEGSFTDEAKRELDQLMYSESDDALAGKNLVSTFIWWGGFAGLLAFIGLMGVLLSNYFSATSVIERMAIVFVVVSYLTYETSLYQYSTPVLVGALLGRHTNQSGISTKNPLRIRY